MNKMKKLKKRSSVRAFIFLLMIAALIPVLYLSIYARPMSDDFANGINTSRVIREGGNFGQFMKAAGSTCYHVYLTWQGTYSSCFIMTLMPGIFDEKLYGLTTWIMIGLIYGGFYAVLSVVKKEVLKEQEMCCWFWATLATAFIVLGFPCPGEAIYWYNGASHYVPWTALTMCNFAVCVKWFYLQSSKKKTGYVVLSCVLSFLISGGNQCTAFANILILFFIIIWSIWKKRSLSLTPSFITTMIGFVIMWIAPGNSVRQGYFIKPGIIKTVVMGALFGTKYALQWLTPVLVCFLVLCSPLLGKIIKKLHNSEFCKHPLLILGASAMIYYGMICVPYYAMGYVGPERLLNIVWMMFVFLIVLNLVCVMGWLETQKPYLEEIHRVIGNQNQWLIGALIAVCFGIICVFSASDLNEFSTSLRAGKALVTNSAQIHAAEWDERFKILSDESQKDVVLKPLTTSVKLLPSSELASDSEYWVNTQLSDYFNKNTIIVEE